MSPGLLALFREKYNFQGGVERFMSANAFAVYLFHPQILIAPAITLHTVAVPQIVKFVDLLGQLNFFANFICHAAPPTKRLGHVARELTIRSAQVDIFRIASFTLPTFGPSAAPS